MIHHGMILEGIVTTLDESGAVNIAPMGPEVDAEMRSLVFKPFQTSTTFRNLQRAGEGVFHVTDDVELLARAAVGQLDPLPRLTPASKVQGSILAEACRWYAFRATSMDVSAPRSRIVTEVVDEGRIRDFFGFNRAKHAVLEAAILATRVGMIPPDDLRSQLALLSVLVQKTGGPAEHRAFDFLHVFIARAIEQSAQSDDNKTPEG
jgi:hypothetical protein